MAEEPRAAGCAICNEVGGPLVTCTVCGMRKHPMGRDPGLAAANGYCGFDCPGYTQEPKPGELWPGERFGDSRGHMEWHDAHNAARKHFGALLAAKPAEQ